MKKMMKKTVFKKTIAVLLTLITLLLAGCQNQEPAQDESGTTVEKIEVVHPLRYFMSSSNSLVWVGNIDVDWKSTLKERGIDFVKEIYETKDGCGHIITANASENYADIVDTYAVYEDDETIYIELIYESAILEKYEVCEINGDAVGEEIVLDYGYTTEVWNFEYRTPNFLFSSEIDLGYSSILNKNYEIVIDNIYTGYQIKVDYSQNENAGDFFDENGKPLDLCGIDFDNYCYDEITVEDIDGDGDGELICKNSVYFPSNDDCIGYTVTTIDYNKDIKGFVVVDTEFVESENGELK